MQDLRDIIIHHKRQIRFSAAEIHQMKLVFFLILQDIVQQLGKPADLPEFIKFRTQNFSVRTGNAELIKHRRQIFRVNDILFLAVVGSRCCGCGGIFGAVSEKFSFFGKLCVVKIRFGHEMRLFIQRREQGVQLLLQQICRKILVKRLLFGEMLGLKAIL